MRSMKRNNLETVKDGEILRSGVDPVPGGVGEASGVYNAGQNGANNDNKGVKVLASGAVYDYDKGRIVGNVGGGVHAITSDTARDMVRRRVEKKRAIIAAAAQEAVQNAGNLARYGDSAWLAEVTQAQMMLATTPDAGKASTLAAGWLVDNTGLGEKNPELHAAAPSSVAGDVSEIINALAGFVAAVQGRDDADIVDGELP